MASLPVCVMNTPYKMPFSEEKCLIKGYNLKMQMCLCCAAEGAEGRPLGGLREGSSHGAAAPT